MSTVLDIIGPVMIGPSSSHTAGAARLGLVARKLLGEDATRARVTLYGSFAKTYHGHGTDRALAAGIMGMATDDVRLRDALDIARERGIDIAFVPSEDEAGHPNTAKLELAGTSGATLELIGSSVGGGAIRVTEIDGMKVNITGQRETFIVLHRDVPGLIAAVTDGLAVTPTALELAAEVFGGAADAGQSAGCGQGGCAACGQGGCAACGDYG